LVDRVWKIQDFVPSRGGGVRLNTWGESRWVGCCWLKSPGGGPKVSLGKGGRKAPTKKGEQDVIREKGAGKGRSVRAVLSTEKKRTESRKQKKWHAKDVEYKKVRKGSSKGTYRKGEK